MSLVKSQSMVDEYFNIYNEKTKEYGDKTAVLIECGSFYEIYEIDNKKEKIGNAYKISNITGLKYANKRGDLLSNNRSYPNFVGFTTNCLQKNLPVLLENDYTVIIVKQLESNNNKSGKLVKRGIVAVYSKCLQPLDNINNTNDCNSNLLNIFIDISIDDSIKKRNTISLYNMTSSVCCVNHFTNSIQLSENKYSFTKESFENSLNEFDNLLYKYNAKEIHIYVIDKDEIQSIFENDLISFFNNRYENVKIHNFDKQKYKQYTLIDYQNQYFKQVYDHIQFGMIQPIEYLEMEKIKLSIINLMYTIDYMGKHDLKYIKNLSIPEIQVDNDHLILELDTLSQLNIDKGVFNIVNFTKTQIGKRYLKSLLCKPLRNSDDIEYRYTLSEELEKHEYYDKIDKLLDIILDFEKLHRKMSLEALNPYEFEKLHVCYLTIIEMIELVRCKHVFNDILPSEEEMVLFHNYIEKYTKTFDLEKLKCFNLNSTKDEISNYFHKGVIKELDDIQENIYNIENEREVLRQYYSSMIETNNNNNNNNTKNTKSTDYVKIAYTESEGYSFTCTKIRYQLLLNNLNKEKKESNFKIKQTNNVVKFFTPELTSLSNKLLNNRELLNNKINIHYINTLKSYYYEYSSIFKSLNKFVRMIDVANSNIKCKNKYNYCKPQFFKNTIDFQKQEKERGESFFIAEGLRHPIIERLCNTNSKYIPNDVSLHNNNIGILLYGLNSSGKSSLLRSIGIAIVLAQAGLYVPCKSFVYRPFHTLISQVDLTDNMYIGKSSFITEMTGLKKILNCKGPNTLILADELCRGTESYSAISIVYSTIMKLIASQTKFFFTTHLHQIAELEQIKKISTLGDSNYALQISHLSVTMKKSIIYFDRKIQPTSGSPLYGLEVCKNIINDDEFINTAFKIRNSLTNNKVSNTGGIIGNKKSQYNRKKIIHHCEICNSTESLETHHIIEQNEANEKGITPDGFHKNNLHNLTVLCHDCHLKVTLRKIITHGYIDSTNGRLLDYTILT